MDSKVSDAAARIRKALADEGSERGWRDPEDPKRRAMVCVVAGDVVTLGNALKEHTEITRDLHRGSSAGKHPQRLERYVIIQADDAYHLLDQVAAAQPSVQATPASLAPVTTTAPSPPAAAASPAAPAPAAPAAAAPVSAATPAK